MINRRYRLLFLAGIVVLYGNVFSASSLLVINDAEFDTATHRFHLSWHLDTSEVPAGCEGAFCAIAGNATPSLPPDNPFPITALSGDSSFVLEPLLTDTVYRTGFLLRVQGTWTIPASAVWRNVTVPPANWEPVRLFPSSVEDTVTLFEQRVLLWRDASFGTGTPQHTDTLRRYIPSESSLDGFHAGGIGFRFTDPVVLPALYIGFRIDATSTTRYHIFRDSSGHLLSEHSAVRDTNRNLLYVKTDRVDLPFLMLADTARPEVTLLSDTGKALGSTPYKLSFSIKENTANCVWNVFSSPAEEMPFTGPPEFSGMLQGTTGKQTCDLSTSGALIAGLRIYLTVNDGTTCDTINLSRSVSRSRCDETTLPADMIMPIATASMLDSTSLRYALRKLFKKTGNRYSSSVFRVFKWNPSGKNSDGWMEYSVSAASQFTIHPGNLYWCISRDEITMDFGKGTSASLIDTISIELPPGEWTDFSSPFGYPLQFGDILAATGPAAEQLHFFNWVKDAVHRTWRAVELYSREVPGIDTPSTRLSNGTGGYCTVYNPADTTVYLRIPPVAAARINTAARKRLVAPGDASWAVRFDLLEGGAVTGSAICGVSSRCRIPVAIPPPPSFGGNLITAGMPGNNRQAYGTVILPLSESGEVTIPLTITNTGRATTRYTCIPNVLAGTIRGTVNPGDEEHPITGPVNLTLGSGESRTVQFTTGSAPRPKEVSDVPAAARILPLTGAACHDRSLVIRYTAPAGNHNLEVVDIHGHRLKVTPPQRVAASNEYRARVQSPTIASGCYLVRLKIGTKSGAGQVLHTKLLKP